MNLSRRLYHPNSDGSSNSIPSSAPTGLKTLVEDLNLPRVYVPTPSVAVKTDDLIRRNLSGEGRYRMAADDHTTPPYMGDLLAG